MARYSRTGRPLVSCEICGKVVTSGSGYTSHLLRVHPEDWMEVPSASLLPDIQVGVVNCQKLLTRSILTLSRLKTQQRIHIWLMTWEVKIMEILMPQSQITEIVLRSLGTNTRACRNTSWKYLCKNTLCNL
jgi:hypothetical protein